MVFHMVKYKRLIIVILLLSAGLLTIYLLRHNLLHAVSHGLIDVDPARRVPLLVVLSGGGWDRGNEAGKLFHGGYAPVVLCTGGNDVPDLQAWGIKVTESEVTRKNLQRNLIPDSCIVLLSEGKSTLEEKDIILRYCEQHNIRDVMILTSLIHTSRCRQVFSKAFERRGIRICLRGSASSRFSEREWWQTEEGLIAINNEWMKHLYYFIRHRIPFRTGP